MFWAESIAYGNILIVKELPVTKRIKSHTKVNRREFLSTAAALGAVATLSGCSLESNPQPQLCDDGKRAFVTGLSDTAYKKARQRAAAVVRRMTLAEKISQLGNTAPAINRLGISSYQYWSEALHGYTGPGGVRAMGATSFPQPLALAGAWNPQLSLRVYEAVSDEVRAWHNRAGEPLTFYSPQTLNLHRDPRWGRCEEAPGEDPCLASTLVVQIIRGMQGDDPNYLKTTACAKHFMCNNCEDDRLGHSAWVNPRSFWEYYTRAYRAAVMEGGVFTVMGAYNGINGIPCCADRFLLTDLLRKRWGFRGYVTSDCDAVYCIYNPHQYVPTLHQAAALAIQAGCDLNCGDTVQKHLGKAVADQLVSEADISRAVTRILTARFLLGEFDPPENVPYNKISFTVVDSPAHRELAVEAARQSIVLLKNDNNFLPLKKSELKTVAVIGPTAAQCHLGGYSGAPFVHISPYEGIVDALSGESDSPQDGRVRPQDLQRVSPGVRTQASSEGGMNIGWISNKSWVEYKPQNFTGMDRIAIRVASPDKGATIRVHADSLSGPIIAKLNVPQTGGWQKWKTISAPIRGITGEHKVFFKFSGGSGGSICNMEWFQLQPVVASPRHQPRLGQPVVIFRPGCTIDGPKDEKMFAEAVEAAKNADVVVMVCGVTQVVDREGHDRHDTRLTGVQHELIQACFRYNPNTVLVLNTNNTVAVNWEQENLPAIVSAIYAGQAQGTAIADVLFGDYNPGGKTCCTWYKSVDQLPPIHNYDIMKGRTYMYFEGDPLYPFGYGLSYTTFDITDMHIDSSVLSEKKSVKVSCTVANTGSRAGAEVVQFYVTVPRSSVKRPIKELVGFQRVELNPGESRRVTFTLPYTAQALWYWHDSLRQFVLQPGKLKLMIGHSSSDIDLTGEVELQACTDAELGGPETLSTVAVPVKVS